MLSSNMSGSLLRSLPSSFLGLLPFACGLVLVFADGFAEAFFFAGDPFLGLKLEVQRLAGALGFDNSISAI